MVEDSGPKPPETDLLGDEWRPLKDPRGRRKLRFAPDVYEKVRHLRGLGMELADIAAAAGISVPSLKKYFFHEISVAEATTKAELLTVLMAKAKSGNVPALKVAIELLKDGAALPPAPTQAKPDPKLGKKEQLNLEAQDGHEGTGWGDLVH